MGEDRDNEWDDGIEPWRGGDEEPLPPARPDEDDEEDSSSSKEDERVGGFAFYLSLAALLPTGILTLVLAVTLWGEESLQPTLLFIIGCIGGAVLAHFTIRDHLSVLIHEFKHSIVSNLVGNKRKGMRVNKTSGHFEYSYTKKTAHYNAFISLAPYILPLFTFVGSLLTFALFRHDHLNGVVLVGVAYGIDLVLNTRDISPVQTDISLIHGGYKVGLLYILAWNLTILGVLLAWVFQSGAGFLLLLEKFSIFFMLAHQNLRSPPSDGLRP